jgi:hypothetical protein
MPVNPISMNINQLGIICPLGKLCKAEERVVVQLTRGRKVGKSRLTLTTLDLSLLAHCSSPVKAYSQRESTSYKELRIARSE